MKLLVDLVVAFVKVSLAIVGILSLLLYLTFYTDIL